MSFEEVEFEDVKIDNLEHNSLNETNNNNNTPVQISDNSLKELGLKKSLKDELSNINSNDYQNDFQDKVQIAKDLYATVIKEDTVKLLDKNHVLSNVFKTMTMNSDLVDFFTKLGKKINDQKEKYLINDYSNDGEEMKNFIGNIMNQVSDVIKENPHLSQSFENFHDEFKDKHSNNSELLDIFNDPEKTKEYYEQCLGFGNNDNDNTFQEDYDNETPEMKSFIDDTLKYTVMAKNNQKNNDVEQFILDGKSISTDFHSLYPSISYNKDNQEDNKDNKEKYKKTNHFSDWIKNWGAPEIKKVDHDEIELMKKKYSDYEEKAKEHYGNYKKKQFNDLLDSFQAKENQNHIKKLQKYNDENGNYKTTGYPSPPSYHDKVFDEIMKELKWF